MKQLQGTPAGKIRVRFTVHNWSGYCTDAVLFLDELPTIGQVVKPHEDQNPPSNDEYIVMGRSRNFLCSCCGHKVSIDSDCAVVEWMIYCALPKDSKIDDLLKYYKVNCND